MLSNSLPFSSVVKYNVSQRINFGKYLKPTFHCAATRCTSCALILYKPVFLLTSYIMSRHFKSKQALLFTTDKICSQDINIHFVL